MSRAGIFILACMMSLGMLERASGQTDSSGKATLDGGKVSIDYGRPSAKGQDVLSKVKPGVYWKIGAVAGATLTSDVELAFGEQKVSKGTYVLVGYFQGGENWTVIVADGSDRGKLVGVRAKAPGRLEKSEEHVEELTIELRSENQEAKPAQPLHREAVVLENESEKQNPDDEGEKKNLVASLLGKLLKNEDPVPLSDEVAETEDVEGEGDEIEEATDDVEEASIVLAWGTSRLVVDFQLGS